MLHLSTRMILFGASRQVTRSPLNGIKAELFSSVCAGSHKRQIWITGDMRK